MLGGMGGEDGASPRVRRRGDEQGDRDAPRARGHRHEAEGESAARTAGGAARNERGARVRTARRTRWAGRTRWRAWGSWVRAWRLWLRAWGSWVLWASPRGVYLAVLGPVLGPILGAICGPANRRCPTPPGLCRTCPAYLVLLRESPRVLPVCATVPRRLATGRPDTALGRGPLCTSGAKIACPSPSWAPRREGALACRETA